MGKTTKISYADSTISPLVGCDGCELLDPARGIKLCYAHALVTRYAGVRGWPKDFFQPEFFPGRLEQAIRWKDLTDTDRPDKPWLNGYPRIVFLGDLADIFAKNAPDPQEWLAPMIPQMAEKHIWLFLTKRPRQMMQFFGQVGYVPRNFWLGTTITSQASLLRAYTLQEIRRIAPEATLWLSIEPLLGDVQLPDLHVDWVVVGGASGPKAPPMHPDWARAIRDWCCLDIPFFFKQWGAWLPAANVAGCALDGREWREMPALPSTLPSVAGRATT